MAPMMNLKKARLMAISLSGAYLIIHIFMFLFFRHFGVVPMMFFNIASMVFYFVLLVISIDHYSRLFPMAVYLEVVLHMVAATYYTGWESGFQITLIGMCVLTSYAEYMGSTLKMKPFRSTPLCLVGMVLYLGLCIVLHYHPAPYLLPENVCYRMQLFWGVVVFTVVIAFLYTFVRITVGSEAYLAEQAGHDKLTGLPNRYFMMDHLSAIQNSGELHDHWVSIIDIDDFKMINDTYGHNCGDSILIQISDLLMKNSEGYTVCRWGGEEFLLVGRLKGSTAECVEKIEILRKQIMESLFVYEERKLQLTVTAGYEEYREGTAIEEWINGADKKLYKGKRNGKNQVVF